MGKDDRLVVFGMGWGGGGGVCVLVCGFLGGRQSLGLLGCRWDVVWYGS